MERYTNDSSDNIDDQAAEPGHGGRTNATGSPNNPTDQSPPSQLAPPFPPATNCNISTSFSERMTCLEEERHQSLTLPPLRAQHLNNQCKQYVDQLNKDNASSIRDTLSDFTYALYNRHDSVLWPFGITTVATTPGDEICEWCWKSVWHVPRATLGVAYPFWATVH